MLHAEQIFMRKDIIRARQRFKDFLKEEGCLYRKNCSGCLHRLECSFLYEYLFVSDYSDECIIAEKYVYAVDILLNL